MFTLICRATDLIETDFSGEAHLLTQFISRPDAFSFLVAAFAGVAGILSLTSAKSGALIGVLISVTTIPAAANIGVAAAIGDWSEWRGAMVQLVVNLIAICLAGVDHPGGRALALPTPAQAPPRDDGRGAARLSGEGT